MRPHSSAADDTGVQETALSFEGRTQDSRVSEATALAGWANLLSQLGLTLALLAARRASPIFKPCHQRDKAPAAAVLNR